MTTKGQRLNDALHTVRKRFHGGRCPTLHCVERTGKGHLQYRFLMSLRSQSYKSSENLFDITSTIAARLDYMLSDDGWLRTKKKPEEIIREFSLSVLPWQEFFELADIPELMSRYD